MEDLSPKRRAHSELHGVTTPNTVLVVWNVSFWANFLAVFPLGKLGEGHRLFLGSSWFSSAFHAHEVITTSIQIVSNSSVISCIIWWFFFFTGATTLYLGLVHGFIKVNLFAVGSLAPCPTTKLEDQGLHFVCPLPFNLSGTVGATRSLHSRQHSSPVNWNARISSSP
jgi:hypothetical protein